MSGTRCAIWSTPSVERPGRVGVDADGQVLPVRQRALGGREGHDVLARVAGVAKGPERDAIRQLAKDGPQQHLDRQVVDFEADELICADADNAARDAASGRLHRASALVEAVAAKAQRAAKGNGRRLADVGLDEKVACREERDVKIGQEAVEERVGKDGVRLVADHKLKANRVLRCELNVDRQPGQLGNRNDDVEAGS